MVLWVMYAPGLRAAAHRTETAQEAHTFRGKKMTLFRALVFYWWFYGQVHASEHMIRCSHWEEQFPPEEEHDLWDGEC
jgi:hypothetical protein